MRRKVIWAVLSLLVILVFGVDSAYAQRGQGRTRGGNNNGSSARATPRTGNSATGQRRMAPSQGQRRGPQSQVGRPSQPRSQMRSAPQGAQSRQYAVPRMQPRSGFNGQYNRGYNQYNRYGQYNQYRQYYNRQYYQGRSFLWMAYPRIWITSTTCTPGYWAYDEYYGENVWVQGYCNRYGFRPYSGFYWPY